ncbi:MAG: acyl-CoA thioesterase [Cytophagales bacterium]|nr:acyl-CoA thioesterase [Cytophagales bacterium]
MKTQLSERTRIKIRFSEVDSLKIVWHGNYAKYLEEGRESFGHKYGLNYLYVFEEGYVTPLVNITVDFKKTVSYGEVIIVETVYENTDAAKIVFNYVVYRESNMEVVAKGKTVQVFLNRDNELCLTTPTFFDAWKRKWNLIS